MSSSKDTKNHLSVLKTVLVDERPPFCSGAISVDAKDLLIFYSNGTNSGHVDFSDPTESDLNRLMQACDPTKFGHASEDVYDESIRKAGKLDSDKFATKLSLQNDSFGSPILDAIRFGLLHGSELLYKESEWSSTDQRRDIRAELYKLNVYGKGGFFKTHKDTPRSADMFGSLVIVLPSVHTGGDLIFQHNSKEWKFSSTSALATAATTATPTIAYAAFYSDVEHEVALVESGLRVTLTYNLYYTEVEEKPIPRISTLSTIPSNAASFRTALAHSLIDSEFLPKDGMLGFGLQHLYPVGAQRFTLSCEEVQTHLKGVDALVLSACIASGLVTRVCLLYDDALLVEREPSTSEPYKDELLYETLATYGGRVVKHPNRFRRPRSPTGSDYYYVYREFSPPDLTVRPITWVTELTHFNEITTEYLLVSDGYFGNEAGITYAYAKLVLIADVGPAGRRETISVESDFEDDSEYESD